MKKHVAVCMTTEQEDAFIKSLVVADRPCVVAHPNDAFAAHAFLKSFWHLPMRRMDLVIDPTVQPGRIYGMDKARLHQHPFVIAEAKEIAPGRRGGDYSLLIIEEAAYEKIPEESIAQARTPLIP